MSMFDGILKGIAGSPDGVTKLAETLGIDPKMAETAISALTKAHPVPGDTVELAATDTGMDTALLSKILSAIGGEASLGNFAKMLDLDCDGNPLDDIAGMAGKLFGKK